MARRTLTAREYALVATAITLIRKRDAMHSHAAAVLTEDGDTFLGVNLFHYAGGPCAEVVALARMLTDTESPPESIVAVARRTYGVVSPCGVCRQIMFDRWPGIGIILDRAGELVRVNVVDLLPEP